MRLAQNYLFYCLSLLVAFVYSNNIQSVASNASQTLLTLSFSPLSASSTASLQTTAKDSSTSITSQTLNAKSIDSNAFSIVIDLPTASKPQNCSKQWINKTNIQQKRLPLEPISLPYSSYLQLYGGKQPCSTSTEQLFYRSQIYNKNLAKINAYNLNASRRYTMGLNQFTDLEEQEFIKGYARLIIPQQLVNAANHDQNKSAAAIQIPKIIVDWQCRSKMTLDQGRCGASHVIAALETIQVDYKTYTPGVSTDLLTFSVQEVLSCGVESRYPDLFGCEGGFFNGVYSYVEKESVGQSFFYLYSSSSRFSGIAPACDNMRNSDVYRVGLKTILSHSSIAPDSCSKIVQALAFRPVAAAIHGKNLQFYKEGIFSQEVDKPYKSKGWQGVTIMGYDPANKFKFKNSWGTQWGRQGYGYVDESAGVCKFASFAITGFQLDPKTPPMCCAPVQLI